MFINNVAICEDKGAKYTEIYLTNHQLDLDQKENLKKSKAQMKTFKSNWKIGKLSSL